MFFYGSLSVCVLYFMCEMNDTENLSNSEKWCMIIEMCSNKQQEKGRMYEKAAEHSKSISCKPR